MIPAQACLLRIYVNASNRWKGKPLYQRIVETARALQLAGASVFSVDLSYGSHHRIHDLSSDYEFYDLPVVVELADAFERVEELMLRLDEMISEGMITLEPVRVIRYAHHQNRPDEIRGSRSESPRFEGSPQGMTSSEGTEATMSIEGEAQRLTIYLGSSDTWHGRNLAVEIVEQCRTLGLAGATLYRGIMGFGKHSRIHRAHVLGLSSDLPERIEIVDRPDMIARILPVLDEMVDGGLVLLEEVRVLRYQGHDDTRST